ncbi:protein of unknown function [Streptococcus thermophilus]|uniref:Uncharacterized protein n=1 Tax=Streptococcus thermophilus TaxID=1308 RepID=A0A8D6U0X6_STRTR|nr:protein of unknown function [Streptococcus thermophilus]
MAMGLVLLFEVNQSNLRITSVFTIIKEVRCNRLLIFFIIYG